MKSRRGLLDKNAPGKEREVLNYGRGQGPESDEPGRMTEEFRPGHPSIMLANLGAGLNGPLIQHIQGCFTRACSLKQLYEFKTSIQEKNIAQFRD